MSMMNEEQLQSITPSASSKKQWFPYAIFVLVLIGVIGFFVLPQEKNVNYIIPSVPYHGQYNHFYDHAFVNPVSAATTIFAYYGDERFSLPALFAQFLQGEIGFSLDTMEQFFKERGYEVARVPFYDSSGMTEEKGFLEMKKFVNKKSRIPVLVLQDYDGDSKTLTYGFNTVIGIFDDTKKVMLHDFNFGNNYELSYDAFLQRFKIGQGPRRGFLAVWPREETRKFLKDAKSTSSYPKRLPIMDTAGQLFITYLEGTSRWVYENDSVKAIQIYEELIRDPRFTSLHPALRIVIYQTLAQVYITHKEYEKAIALMNEKALPLNHDLDVPFNNWKIDIRAAYPSLREQKLAVPYVVLAEAFFRKGDKKQAQKYLDEALALHPRYREEVMETIILPVFDALQK